MNQIEQNNLVLLELINQLAPRFMSLSNEAISEPRNSQNRNVRQILGHMIDSASNNTHRVIHLQYQESPLQFPNYASNGNNDRWIAIQNYENEKWENMVNLWKFIHLHFVHTVRNINPVKLQNQWDAGNNDLVSLEDMVLDFLRHFKLHISEIEELLS